MSRKARLRRLDADIQWMKAKGWAKYRLKWKLHRFRQAFEAEMARRQAEADRPETPVKPILRPAPREEVKPVEAPPEPVPPPPEPPSPEPPPPELPPPEPSVVQTFDVPEHMQIRPTRWRLRGPEDYDWDAGANPPDDEYG